MLYDLSTYQSITSAETTKTMTRIKICGLTSADDARAAVRFGADALGFIAVPDTPRFVSPDRMRAASAGYPPS
jgi:phosphoribosylanthranilate isomerase